ncbi:MAG: bifunctional riboflavin kinase/FAD synthetase [Chitinophagales bacterium]|nr:bifunctional riboflavin kinase/FAD synthetase [Chitinophagales bacterium]
MRVFTQLDDLPRFRQTVLTIGTFDGVHLAHRQIIRRVCDLALREQGESVLLTFHPHPRSVIKGGDAIGLLSPLAEKIDLLKQIGLQNVVVTPFTPQFAEQSPEQYIADFLVRYFQPKHIVIGYDHRYGRNRSGGLELLQQYGLQNGFVVEEIPKQQIDNIAISSTKIRKALTQGDLETATALLGYQYCLCGTVVRGRQLGRTIGFPTANLNLNDPDKLLPRQGVYAAQAHTETGDSYAAMLNIGKRPTVSGSETLSIEAHLLDFPPGSSLYDQTLKLELYQYLRPEQKFDGIAALRQQLMLDEQQVREILKT